MKKTQPTFLYGLGRRRPLKGFTVPKINWNTGSITPALTTPKVLVGFSMGAIKACEHALHTTVEHLVLCSPTTGIETLSRVKAKKVTFICGKRERWVLKEIKRVAPTLRCPYEIHVISGIDHIVDEKYRKTIVDMI